MRPGYRFAALALVLLAGLGLWIVWPEDSGEEHAGGEAPCDAGRGEAAATSPPLSSPGEGGEVAARTHPASVADNAGGATRTPLEADPMRPGARPGGPIRDNLLDVQVLSCEGRPLAYTELGLLAETALFSGEPDWIARHRWDAAEDSPVKHIESDLSASFMGDSQGHVRLRGLAAGIPFQTKVYGLGCGEVATGEIAPLEPSEIRHETIRLAEPHLSLRGVVLDESDTPLEGARLMILSSQERVTSDSNGRFLMEPFFSEPIELLVSKRGFMPRRRSLVHTQIKHPVTFRLGCGETLSARIEDELGQPLSGASLEATISDLWAYYSPPMDPPPWTIREVSPGEFLVEHLPPGPVGLRARYFVYSRSIATHTNERRVRFAFPPFGRVHVHWKIPEAERDQLIYRITLERADPTQGAVSYTVGEDEGLEGTTLFEAVETGTYRLLLERIKKEYFTRAVVDFRRLARQEDIEVVANSVTTLRIEARQKRP